MAITNSRPMNASSNLPGSPANRSTCRRSMTIMKPPLAEGISRASPVRPSSMKVWDELGSVPGVGAMMVMTPLGSSSSQPKYWTTSPGRWALAFSTSCCRSSGGVSAGISRSCGASPSRCSISWWKINGSPVIASISRNTVQIRLVQVWTKDQRRMVLLFMIDPDVKGHLVARDICGSKACPRNRRYGPSETESPPSRASLAPT